MEWQTSADTAPTSFITEEQARSLLGRPPASAAWRESDPEGHRRFVGLGPFTFDNGGQIPYVRMAYETWGELSPAGDNAILLLHALTGDSHAAGEAGQGHPTPGWWDRLIGPGKPLDTDRFFVVCPNVLGGCQGTTGPASLAPDGYEWAGRFPFTTIRDQVRAYDQFRRQLGIERWHAALGGSMGGMHALELGIMFADTVERLGVLAAPPRSSADQIAVNGLQLEAIATDPLFRAGNYYDADPGEGPHQGLALARRMALLHYRSAEELNGRFQRSWQSDITPLGSAGRFAIESYLDFHGNKFTRRFDANSYITLVKAMNSHDVTRGRGDLAEALSMISAPTLVLGIDSDRLFPLGDQIVIARTLAANIDGDEVALLSSPYGHDSFLIEDEAVGNHITRLLRRS